MIFYLGSHRANWLASIGVPLFVSHRTLRGRKTYPRAIERWALDSGGFTELSTYGGWQTSTKDYLGAVSRYRSEVGSLDWAAPQDWMCEPWIIEKTGLSVVEHQARTVGNYLELKASGLPFIPVLQGWELSDYERCAEMYRDAGVDLTVEPIVGVGSVCRRQHSGQIEDVMLAVRALGLRLHGFGVKTTGLSRYGYLLESADSMAWSYRGRRTEAPPDHTHRNEAGCLPFALAWRERVLDRIEHQQGHLWGAADDKTPREIMYECLSLGVNVRQGSCCMALTQVEPSSKSGSTGRAG